MDNVLRSLIEYVVIMLNILDKHTLALEDQLSSLNALEKRISTLESSFHKFSEAILTDETRYSRIKNGVFYSNVDSKLTAISSFSRTDSCLIATVHPIPSG